MRIGIIGSGNIGANVARLAVAADHDVVIANSRGPHSLTGLVDELGELATAGTVADAAAGDLVVVAIPLGAYPALDTDLFTGRVVVDAGNYYPRRDGTIAPLDDHVLGSSELVAEQWLPGARVVKAFNTIHFRELTARADRDAAPDHRLAVPVAADDADAKAQVIRFVDSLGLAAVDIGDLAAGRRIQPGADVYATTLTPGQLRARLDAS